MVKVNIKPNPVLNRVGNNVFSKDFITFGEAIEGKMLEIKTVKQLESVFIP